MEPKYTADGLLSLEEDLPLFELPDTISESVIRNSDAAGQITCIVVSCNHCPHVIKNEERLIDIGNEFGKKGIKFLLVSANDVTRYPQDSPAEMKKRAQMKGYPFAYLYDESQVFVRALGAQVTPQVFLFDETHKLRYRGAVDDNPDLADRPTRHYLREALGALIEKAPESIEFTATRAIGCGVKWKV